MKFISHRGNIEKKIVNEENKPEKILYCLKSDYEVEIDIWLENERLFLGHDKPQYEINKKFILDHSNMLWCHAKNLNALRFMLLYKEINCFWHQNDDYTITSYGIIWCYPGKNLSKNSIAVMPESVNYATEQLKQCYGICSDNIELYKSRLLI